MIDPLAAYWRGMASGARNGGGERLLQLLLFPAAACYGMILRLRTCCYRLGLFRRRKLPRPVISIGNITVGGTGKTPTTALVARLLLSRGKRVAVLSRGYGGTLEGTTAVVSDGERLLLTAEECGDEPYLLARTVPGLAVIIGSDRHAAGLLALESCAPDLFLLDDGFQHLRLQRDLDILLLDVRRPFGNGLCLPAGLLREPLGAVARAHLAILTHCPAGMNPPTPLPGKPFCRSRHRPGSLTTLTGEAAVSAESLKGSRLAAFCGIAEPDQFFASLRSAGLPPVSTLAFPDHVRYDESRTAELEAFIAASGADRVLTTEKDGVKLGRLAPQYASRILLAGLELTLDDPAPLEEALCNLLQKST